MLARKDYTKTPSEPIKKNISEYDASIALSKNKLIRGIHTSLKEKRAAYEEADYLSKEFHGNKELYDRYLKKAHAKDAKELGYDPNDMKDIREMADWHMESTMDLYPGSAAFRLYLKDKGVNPRTYMENAHKAYIDYMGECKKAANTMLSEIGNKRVTEYTSMSSAAASALIERAIDDWDRNYLYSRGYDY